MSMQVISRESINRLYSSKHVHGAERVVPDENDTECTFAPRLNEESRRIMQNRPAKSGVEASKRLSLMHFSEKSKERMELLRSHHKDMDMAVRVGYLDFQLCFTAEQECTFTPKVVWGQQKAGRHTVSSGGIMPNTLSFVHRAKAWAEEKEEKLRQKRQTADRQNLSECTFRPCVTPHKKKRPSATITRGSFMRETQSSTGDLCKRLPVICISNVFACREARIQV